MTRIESPNQFVIFEGLTAQDSDAILQRGEVITVKKGTRVIEAGQPASALLLVRSGKIELRFNLVYFNESIEACLEILGAGEVIGWSALIPPHKYTLAGYATEDSELLQIKGSSLQDYCDAHPRVGSTVMGNLARIVSKRYEITRQLLIGEIQRDLKKKEGHSLWKSD
ncbi:MAG: cyclic nucleotide-binding domain-containing protein [Methanomicrobiales archaeon]|nr:cyclic nucleotide-binding domain-containing protein [Methanomicrobiales archaeon]